tara:strand:+ start:2561 stop:3100 length:540 start_codon:yes stop_codon:yes gene_type:complete
MSSILNKIIFGICIVISLNGCHTFEHENPFVENNKEFLNQQFPDVEYKNKQTSQKTINNEKLLNKTEMAPIKTPAQKNKVQKFPLQKKVKFRNSDKFNINKFKNWTELKLIKIMGKSNFIKEEGKLKNFQYHFEACFLDVFLIKKYNGYFVNYLEIRPTRLYGKVNTDACLEEIKEIVN